MTPALPLIDLRSDTVTLPTPAMRAAMASADVGDDVFGEDPTINRLERLAAERIGKEAALYVPSGTMANLTAMLTHCGRGGAIVCGDRAHVYRSELGGAAALGGLAYRPVPNLPDGSLDQDALARELNNSEPGGAALGLVCLENTHNYCAGAPISVEVTQAAADGAHRAGVPLHLDGARIFNAAVALGVSASALAGPADSVSFCLSKGLAAPVGSLLCGSGEFIARARRTRKMLGGGMRQAGVLAAAGIVALNEMVERLADDHANARLLAEGLAELPRLTPLPVSTNIIIVQLQGMTPAEFVRMLGDAGVLAVPFGPGRVRFVTHYGIKRADIEQVVSRIRSVVSVAA